MSKRSPNGTNTFHLQHFLLVPGLHSEIVFNQLCSVLLQQLKCPLSVSLPLSVSHTICLSLCSHCCGKCGAYEKPAASQSSAHTVQRGNSLGLFLTGQLHKYALQLTMAAKWQHEETSKLKNKKKNKIK